jgi:hypothetical protein
MNRGAGRFRDASNPASLLDDDPDPDQRPHRTPRSQPRRSTGPRDIPRASRNTRPDEVTERMWGLAGQWLELGEARLGQRPAINLPEFAKRFAAKVNSDRELLSWAWKVYPGSRWSTGADFVNDVIVRMIELFWDHLTVEQTNTPSLQFAFLEDEWDEWAYQALTSLKVAYYRENGTWEKPVLPSAVFDASTVGRPDPDAPCTDPAFEGMTWGEVWAQQGHDVDLWAARDDEPEPAPEADFAIVKRAIVANHTTKETHQ